MKGDLELPEEAIARVLGAMREAEVSPGLERRVIAALEDRTNLGAAAGTRVWTKRGEFVGMHWTAGARVALVAVLVGAVTVGAIEVRHAALRSQAKVWAVANGPAKTGSAEGSRPSLASTAAILDGTEALVGKADVLRHGRPAAAKNVSVRGVQVLTPLAKEGLPEGSARELASFPAPPLPLTEQERLLLRVVHRGVTQEMAMLDPVARVAEARKERAQFQEFFEPATVAPRPVPDAAPNAAAPARPDQTGATPVYLGPRTAAAGADETLNGNRKGTRRRR